MGDEYEGLADEYEVVIEMLDQRWSRGRVRELQDAEIERDEAHREIQRLKEEVRRLKAAQTAQAQVRQCVIRISFLDSALIILKATATASPPSTTSRSTVSTLSNTTTTLTSRLPPASLVPAIQTTDAGTASVVQKAARLTHDRQKDTIRLFRNVGCIIEMDRTVELA